jgi:hypothetical protein
MKKFANPENSGVANISSMIVPCIVKSWLKVSWCINCIPGYANSARISRARMPPKTKKNSDVPKYSRPIFLWSVVVM